MIFPEDNWPKKFWVKAFPATATLKGGGERKESEEGGKQKGGGGGGQGDWLMKAIYNTWSVWQ